MRTPELRVTASPRSLALLATALLCIGCTAPAAQVSQSPSAIPTTTSSAIATATAAVATRSPTADQSVAAASTPGSSVITGFEFSDILQVQVDGLAVREAPSLTSDMAQGYRYDGATYVPTGDVRLGAGDFVSVHLGPLPIGDTIWYLVWPAEEGRLNYSPSGSWDSNGSSPSVSGNDPAWVAASVGEDDYLTLNRRPEPSEIEQFGSVGLTLSGTGDYESEPLARTDLFSFNWAVAADDHPAPCEFMVTLVPDDGTEPMVAVEASTTDVEQGPVTGSGSPLDWPRGTSAGGPADTFTVSITSGCTGAVGLKPLPHD